MGGIPDGELVSLPDFKISYDGDHMYRVSSRGRPRGLHRIAMGAGVAVAMLLLVLTQRANTPVLLLASVICFFMVVIVLKLVPSGRMMDLMRIDTQSRVATLMYENDSIKFYFHRVADVSVEWSSAKYHNSCGRLYIAVTADGEVVNLMLYEAGVLEDEAICRAREQLVILLDFISPDTKEIVHDGTVVALPALPKEVRELLLQKYRKLLDKNAVGRHDRRESLANDNVPSEPERKSNAQ